MDDRLPKTAGVLKKEHLIKSPHTGTIVSNKLSLQMAVRYQGSKLQLWNASVSQGRHVLGFEGRFVPVGGQSFDGRRLLWWTRAFYALHLADREA